MLGSLTEADDAVQESWLRLSRSEAEVRNLGGWLTTVVGRVCLDMLRSRRSRREDPWEVHVPDPIVAPVDGTDPEQQALLADSVGLALMVVLDTLSPQERLAFVLHDMFGLSFGDIAPIVERSPATASQLASRARRRVRGAAPGRDADLGRQRKVVEAYIAASRNGDFEALLAVLDPAIVLRVDYGELSLGAPSVVRGAENVAHQARLFARPGPVAELALINGTVGAVVFLEGRLTAVVSFTIASDRIIGLDILADPRRLDRLDLDLAR